MNTRLSLLFLALIFISSCQKDSLEETLEQSALQTKATNQAELVLICHYDSDLDEYKQIEVAQQSVQAHLNHGDSTGDCNKDGTYVPDDAFEQLLIDQGYDDVLDDYVATENINTIETLLINNCGGIYPVADLTGIEDFVALTELTIACSPLSSLDLSNNTTLTFIRLYEVSTTSLELGNNTALNTLKIQNTPSLTNLDLSSTPNLTELELISVPLASLDLSMNTNLTRFQLRDFNTIDNPSIPITILDLTNNTNLTFVSIRAFELTNLTLPTAPDLSFLNLLAPLTGTFDLSPYTLLENVAFRITNLESIDLSNNAELRSAVIGGNEALKTINLQNGTNAANNLQVTTVLGNPNLECVQVDDVDYSTNNWSFLSGIGASGVYSLDCGY
ncbi:hypothetical protein [[Muricauda] lutisoli]|uniref:Leucine-rich repeat domain-containing protein n=1 Tax=[Muricauda] lutisoli TaxID=2816035 RepID=A0ABS3EYC4_9FLAO|nr:hypothetical protein [[Muricauda] lutisoli]MBO0331264.1 hypothetical protein [[Muricauda] lutisoli]